MAKFNPSEDFSKGKQPREQRSFHIPPGTYPVNVEDVELRMPKNPTKAETTKARPSGMLSLQALVHSGS